LAAAGGFLAGKRVAPHKQENSNQIPTKKERKILFYRNPMNPAITSPVPAKDEMGMDYIPVYEDEEGSAGPAGTVKIDPVVVQNIGVRTAKAKYLPMSKVIKSYGRIAYDEESISVVHPKFKGWIEEQFVSKTGEYVEKGQDLVSIYSPELVSTQEEYLLALSGQKLLSNSPVEMIRKDAEALAKAARRRLKLFDIPEETILKLEQTGEVKKELVLKAPFNGTILKIGALTGDYVTPMTELYKVADLSSVWVYGDVYEYDLAWIKKGDEVLIKVMAVPEKTFKGKIDFIYPYEQGKSRTVRVRIAIANPDLALKPDMFANITIHGSLKKRALVVPSEAIIRSGEREQVFVKRAPGKFEPRTVTLGLEAYGFTEILSGLEEGEEVVTSSQFLIDSESKLKEATAKMLKQDKAHDSGAANGNTMKSMEHSND